MTPSRVREGPNERMPYYQYKLRAEPKSDGPVFSSNSKHDQRLTASIFTKVLVYDSVAEK